MTNELISFVERKNNEEGVSSRTQLPFQLKIVVHSESWKSAR